MTPEQIAHIMALVDDYARVYAFLVSHRAARNAIEAALAPQQAVPTDEELTAIYKRVNGEDTGKAQPLTTQRIFKAMRAMLAARPSAPTAVEPDERAEFEAWCDSQPIKPFPMHMAAKAFAAGFAARASKGK